MTSDETPREPREEGHAPSTGATGATGNTGPAEAGSTGSTGSAGQQESGPPGPSQAPGGEQNGAPAEQHTRTRSSPPNGGGENRAPGRLPPSTWIVTLICTTMYTAALALILIAALLGIVLDSMGGGSRASITVPAGALALTAFLFWAVRLMLAAARFPRPTAAMVLFTALLLVGFAGSVALPSVFGFIESADGVLTAAVAASVLAALMMLVSRGARVRWAAAASAAVLVVACVVTWARGEAQEEPMVEEQRQINLGHEDEAAVLDTQGWEPYRSEINDAVHANASDAGGAGEEETLSVFTVFYQDGNGGYLRTATWADERTAEDPEAVLRGWCDEEGAYCQDLEVEGADGPVVAQWELEGPEDQSTPADPEELGAPDSVRYEYGPGRVVYLGPWTEEPDRSQGGDSGAEPGTGQGAGATLGHVDFEAQEPAEWATQVRPAQEEDLLELAERTVEYIQGPEEVLTES